MLLFEHTLYKNGTSFLYGQAKKKGRDECSAMIEENYTHISRLLRYRSPRSVRMLAQRR